MVFTTYKAAEYGFKIKVADRDKFFSRNWKNIVLKLPIRNGFIEAVCNIEKPSFWNDKCHEVIKKEIGLWLMENEYAKWSKRKPFKFEVKHIRDNVFELIGEVK